jgi:hypothetical protein
MAEGALLAEPELDMYVSDVSDDESEEDEPAYDGRDMSGSLVRLVDSLVSAEDDTEQEAARETKDARAKHRKAFNKMVQARRAAGIQEDPMEYARNPVTKQWDVPLPARGRRSADQRSGDGAEATANNNETRSASADLGTTEQRGLRSLMLGAAPSGGSKYSTTLVGAVATPGGDGRSVLAPGAASVPHRFFSPGLYLWHDQRNTAIHGVVVVEPSDIAVDACGVCGGDNSTCSDCLGVPHGAARLDACGVCSDPTAAGYTPNPAIDCAGVCRGSAALDGCGECTGGTTGRLTGASMDCAGVCGGTARVDCKGVCDGSGRLDWHEGRPSSTIDIGCTGDEGCCTQLSLLPTLTIISCFSI